MKKFHTGFIYLIITAILVLALSAPALSSAAYAHATLLESIQQQIYEILAAVGRIQARIEELIMEAAQPPVVAPAVLPVEPLVGTETLSPSTELVWKFLPLPSAYLSEPLAILYRFSITGSTIDTTIPSVTFTYNLSDVSIKNLEIYAFSDDVFSAPTFLRSSAAKQNRVGKQIGYLDAQSKTVTILFDQGPPSVTIPVGETYYFELRGTVVGKNRDAFLTIGAGELSSVTLE